MCKYCCPQKKGKWRKTVKESLQCCIIPISLIPSISLIVRALSPLSSNNGPNRSKYGSVIGFIDWMDLLMAAQGYYSSESFNFKYTRHSSEDSPGMQSHKEWEEWVANNKSARSVEEILINLQLVANWRSVCCRWDELELGSDSQDPLLTTFVGRKNELEDVLNNRRKALSSNCNLIAYEGEYFDYSSPSFVDYSWKFTLSQKCWEIDLRPISNRWEIITVLMEVIVSSPYSSARRQRYHHHR